MRGKIPKDNVFIETVVTARQFAIAANPKKPQREEKKKKKHLLKCFKNQSEIETVTPGRQMVTLAAVWIKFCNALR